MKARPILLATALLAAAIPAHAEGTIARIAELSGNVLVSRDFNIASATGAERLAEGTRLLATAKGSAIVVFDDGCRVKVAAGERFEVRKPAGCGALVQGDAADAESRS